MWITISHIVTYQMKCKASKSKTQKSKFCRKELHCSEQVRKVGILQMCSSVVKMCPGAPATKEEWQEDCGVSEFLDSKLGSHGICH
jgi:hypothetical protein